MYVSVCIDTCYLSIYMYLYLTGVKVNEIMADLTEWANLMFSISFYSELLLIIHEVDFMISQGYILPFVSCWCPPALIA